MLGCKFGYIRKIYLKLKEDYIKSKESINVKN